MPLARFTTPYVYIVKTEFASREQEAAWNEWYDRVHVPGGERPLGRRQQLIE